MIATLPRKVVGVRRRPIEKLVSGIINVPPIRIAGYYEVQLINAKSGTIKYSTRFKNLITNGGLDYIGAGNILDNGLNNLAVGTSETAPANTDTALGAELVRTTSNGGFADTSGWGASNAYVWRKRTRNFTESQANGNLAELGWYSTGGSPTLINHSRIKDPDGTPITITKTSADQLRVIYEWRVYPPSADVTGTVTINSITYDTVIRPTSLGGGMWNSAPQNIGTWGASGSLISSAYETNTLVANTATPSGTNDQADTNDTAATYTNGNYYRDITLSFGPARANFTTGVGLVYTQPGGYAFDARMFQCNFTPKLPKDNLKRLTLVYRYNFGRYP